MDSNVCCTLHLVDRVNLGAEVTIAIPIRVEGNVEVLEVELVWLSRRELCSDLRMDVVVRKVIAGSRNDRIAAGPIVASFSNVNATLRRADLPRHDGVNGELTLGSVTRNCEALDRHE
ncbi:MAG: hypothetical protein EOP24_42045 [Hyphomicrobiales bacterium]|nr:MAG: hypothetical protein EOP24_42045 [Hyphomicrobiales bacterium]